MERFSGENDLDVWIDMANACRHAWNEMSMEFIIFAQKGIMVSVSLAEPSTCTAQLLERFWFSFRVGLASEIPRCFAGDPFKQCFVPSSSVA